MGMIFFAVLALASVATALFPDEVTMKVVKFNGEGHRVSENQWTLGKDNVSREKQDGSYSCSRSGVQLQKLSQNQWSVVFPKDGTTFKTLKGNDVDCVPDRSSYFSNEIQFTRARQWGVHASEGDIENIM